MATLKDIDDLSLRKGFFIGITNIMMTQIPSLKPDMIINLDLNKIETPTDTPAKDLSSYEKKFIYNLNKSLAQMDHGLTKNQMRTWDSLNEDELMKEQDYVDAQIKNSFYDFFCRLIINMSFCRKVVNDIKSLGIIDEDDAISNEEPVAEQEIKLGQNFSPHSPPAMDEFAEISENGEVDMNNSPGDCSQDTSELDHTEASSQSEHEFITTPVKKESKAIDLESEEILVINNRNSVLVETAKDYKESWVELQKQNLLDDSLSNYKTTFLYEWSKTLNFRLWSQKHNDEIAFRHHNSGFIPNTKIFYENGDVYTGALHGGLKVGNGSQFQLSSMRTYTGEWKEGMMHGSGSITSETMDYVYDGQLYKDMKHGEGQLIEGKVKYSGQFKFDKYDGNGVLCDSNGNIFDGEWREGQRNGMGNVTYSDGSTYLGEFRNNVMHGNNCQYKYSDGRIYIGNFEDGTKCGDGQMIFKVQEGEKYIGNWKYGKPNGKGQYWKSKDWSVKAIWDEGKVYFKPEEERKEVFDGLLEEDIDIDINKEQQTT